MSFQRSASFIRVLEASTDTRSGQSLSASTSDTIDLPVDNMEVKAKPIVPEGGTAQMDYDDYVWFENPTFRLTLSLTWSFERTDFRPSFQDTLQDLVTRYLEGSTTPVPPLDFYVKYTGPPKQYDQTAYDTNYVCPKMVPDLEEDDAGLIFESRAREKERTIMFKSKSSTIPWGEAKFTFD